MRQKTMNLKLAMTADLTGVPRPVLSEEEELDIQATRTLLLNKLLTSSDSVSDVRNRHDEKNKYDRIIGISADGELVMLPLSCGIDDCYHAILLSDLRSDKFLFYMCSGPVAQTGESKVRSIFVPTNSRNGVGFPPDCSIEKDTTYLGMADITGQVTVKCAYIQTYYGRLSNAYLTSVFAEGEIDDGYCMRILEGEIPMAYEPDNRKSTPNQIATSAGAVEKAKERYVTPDGKKPTTYEEAIAHIFG